MAIGLISTPNKPKRKLSIWIVFVLYFISTLWGVFMSISPVQAFTSVDATCRKYPVQCQQFMGGSMGANLGTIGQNAKNGAQTAVTLFRNLNGAYNLTKLTAKGAQSFLNNIAQHYCLTSSNAMYSCAGTGLITRFGHNGYDEIYETGWSRYTYGSDAPWMDYTSANIQKWTATGFANINRDYWRLLADGVCYGRCWSFSKRRFQGDVVNVKFKGWYYEGGTCNVSYSGGVFNACGLSLNLAQMMQGLNAWGQGFLNFMQNGANFSQQQNPTEQDPLPIPVFEQTGAEEAQHRGTFARTCPPPSTWPFPGIVPWCPPTTNPSTSVSQSTSTSVSVTPSVSVSQSYFPPPTPSFQPSSSTSTSQSTSTTISFQPSSTTSTSSSTSVSTTPSSSTSATISINPSSTASVSTSTPISSSTSVSTSFPVQPSQSASQQPSFSTSTNTSVSQSTNPSQSVSSSINPSQSTGTSTQTSSSISQSQQPSQSITPSQSTSQSIMPSINPSLSNSQDPSIDPSISTSSSISNTTSVVPTINPSLSNSQSVNPSINPSQSIQPSQSISQDPSTTISQIPSISTNTSTSSSIQPSQSSSISNPIYPTVSISPSQSISQDPTISTSLSISTSLNTSIDPTSSIEPTPTISCQPTAPNSTTSVLYLPGPDRANWDGVNYVNYRITDDGCTEVIEAQIDPVTAPTPEDVQVPDLPDITYNRTNFFSYAVDQWSNKFPFGIVGDFQGIAGSNTCPSWTFLGVQVTLCIVRDAIAILKYPAIIAFLVRTYHFA